MTKRKETDVFIDGTTTIELSEVSGLGWFIEIEELVSSESADVKKEAKNKITSIIRDLGIPEEKIEERYYTELLTGKTEA